MHFADALVRRPPRSSDPREPSGRVTPPWGDSAGVDPIGNAQCMKSGDQPQEPPPMPPGATRRLILFFSGVFLLGIAAILYGVLRRSTIQWGVLAAGIVMLL